MFGDEMAYVTKRIRMITVRMPAPEPGLDLVAGPQQAVPIFKKMLEGLDGDKEHFLMLALNARGRVIGVHHVATGVLTASLVHPREVYRPAIAMCAASIIVAHNHPSGDPTPSDEDEELTRRLAEAGKLLGIPLHDHIVLTAGGPFRSIETQALGAVSTLASNTNRRRATQ